MKFKRFAIILLLVVLTFLFVPVCSNASNGYDDAENIRRAAELLKKYDSYQKNQAKRRYDKTHRSDSELGPEGVLCCIGIIIIIVGTFISITKSGEQQMPHNRTKSKLKTNHNGMNPRLERYTELGFSIEEATKKCPSCSKEINIMATKCRHCNHEFDEQENEKCLDEALDRFYRGLGGFKISANQNLEDIHDK
ncbi:MAG: hypothetical protein J7L40_00080 [Candidatus Marinimicrobia bacterium]|nr:hypothetical protein [Candidatus Neomarinimicrobiota bacterium]